MAVLETHEQHQELIDELIADVSAYNAEVDRDRITRAFLFAAEAHEGQQRRSGEDFVLHPWGAAKICAQLRLDDETIAAALLHDVVEDTDVELDEVRAEFGEEIAKLVEGVTKLTRVQFQSREQAEAENYRKLIVAMAEDVRVILIKLADRLHNLREIEYLGKQKQVQKAKETLEVYAPLAHRLGIHAMKWELEDLAFETLHPRQYAEIQAMDAGPVQGLHRNAEVQPLPVPAHDGDRTGGTPARDPGAHPRDARDGRARDRRALALQGRPASEDRRGMGELGSSADGGAARHDRRAGRVHARVPDGSRRRRGLRVHSQRRGEDAALRLDADRLRLRGAHGCGPPHRRREDQRPDRPASLPPEERRLRRDPDLEGRTRAVPRLALPGRVLARA